MENLEALADGRLVAYVMTRLWDYTEKMKSEMIENTVLNGILRAMDAISIKAASDIKMTFVPFRDSSQEKINDPQKTKIIFNRDVERLNKLFLIAGFYDGLSKDEGMSMEIGYAYGKGAPIIILRTDFIRQEFKHFVGQDILFDPIIEAMASKIVYNYKIPEANKTYTERLREGMQNALKDLEDAVFDISVNHNLRPKTANMELDCYDVYIDFGGGLFEWEKVYQEKLSKTLVEKGLSCCTASRYCTKNNNSKELVNVKQRGMLDIERALQSKVIVTCGDSSEMNSGSAAIQGMACALGKKIIFYDSKATNMVADGQYRSSHNLMIDYSANQVVRSFDDIPSVVLELLNTISDT